MEYDYIEVVDDSDIGDNISLTLEITFAKTKTSYGASQSKIIP